MHKHTEAEGNNASCAHRWVTREKKNISILVRACTECGRLEHHTEADIDEKTLKAIMKR